MRNLSTTDQYPKTLFIYNTLGGMIWQVYHVQSLYEASQLADNAQRNFFLDQTLNDYDDSYEETFPDWRETEGGKRIINKTRQ